MTDHDRRLATVEGDLSRVRVILEGKPIKDIAGNLIGTEGGIVKQGERHEEMLYVVSHQLTGITDKLNSRWSLTHRIAASGVVAVVVVPLVMWIGG